MRGVDGSPGSRCFHTRLNGTICLFFVWYLTISVPLKAQESARALVSRTLDNENLNRATSQHFSFIAQEKSTRTGGHLWIEKSVLIESGVLRRLMSVDGTPLSAEKARSEDRRIANLVAHPDEFSKANRAMKGDQKSFENLSHVIPRAFVFSYDGDGDGCTRIRFQPDPSFAPATYEQRILTALVGTVLIKEPDDRLCGFEARISHPVEFGFGLIGKLDQDGHIHVVRTRTNGGNWQASLISVSIVGRIFFFKSITQNHDELRTEIKDIPPNLTLAQAAELTKP